MLMKKRILALALAAVMAGSLTACSGSSGTDTKAAPAQTEAPASESKPEAKEESNVGETIQEQTEQVLKIIVAILSEAGTDFDHVVKTTCFLSDMNDFVPFNEVYQTAFKEEFPARSAVEVARLPRDVKVEIEVIAEIG